MLLSEWIAREGRGALTKLQHGSGKTFATVARIAKGTAMPEMDTAIALSRATGGECSPQEILEEAHARKAKAKANAEVA